MVGESDPCRFYRLMIRWTGLAPWEFEFPSPGSLTSTFLSCALRAGAPPRRLLRSRSGAESCSLDTGTLLPNNQRQHHTSHAPKDVLPLRICANHCLPCQQPLRAFPGWIRSPPLGGDSGWIRSPPNSHSARPVHLIITMMKWSRTSPGVARS